MFVFILVVVLVFLLVVVLFNFDKIKAWLKSKLAKKPKKENKPKEQPKEKESKVSYEEYKPEVKVDNLHNDETVEYTETPYVPSLTEEEEKVLENPSKGKAGRLKGDIKSVDDLKVEVEDLGEYNEDEGFMNAEDVDEFEVEDDLIDDLDFDSDLFDDFEFDDIDLNENKTIGDEIRNLSPEVKALLIDNVLKRKD